MRQVHWRSRPPPAAAHAQSAATVSHRAPEARVPPAFLAAPCARTQGAALNRQHHPSTTTWRATSVPKEKARMLTTPNRNRRRARVLGLAAIAAFAATAAPVHAQAPESATVTSTETSGMRYVGGNADNRVRVTLSGEHVHWSTTSCRSRPTPVRAGPRRRDQRQPASRSRCPPTGGSRSSASIPVPGTTRSPT